MVVANDCDLVRPDASIHERDITVSLCVSISHGLETVENVWVLLLVIVPNRAEH